MTKGQWFWIIYVVALLFFGFVARRQPWFFYSLIGWVLLGIIGYALFGSPIK